MSEPTSTKPQSYVDERGNISVRVSQDVQVLTLEEADRIEAEYKRMQAENAKLRELVRELYDDQCDDCDRWKYHDRMRELGMEVDAE